MHAARANTCGGSTRKLLSAALIVIGAVAMYGWTVAPHVGYLRAVQRLKPAVAEMAAEKHRICGTLDAKRLKLRTVQQELARVREQVFTREQARVFLRDLQPLVEQTGCGLVVADFTGGDDAGQAREPRKPAAARASHVSLTVQGQYDQLVALVERLRSNRQKVWVDSCHIERFPARPGQLRCRLALTMYTLLDPGEPHR